MKLSYLAVLPVLWALVCTYFAVENNAEHLMVSAVVALVIAGLLVLADLALYILFLRIENQSYED